MAASNRVPHAMPMGVAMNLAIIALRAIRCITIHATAANLLQSSVARVPALQAVATTGTAGTEDAGRSVVTLAVEVAVAVAETIRVAATLAPRSLFAGQTEPFHVVHALLVIPAVSRESCPVEGRPASCASSATSLVCHQIAETATATVMTTVLIANYAAPMENVIPTQRVKKAGLHGLSTFQATRSSVRARIASLSANKL